MTHNWVGQLTPLHCTSSGKVLLAHLSIDCRDLAARWRGWDDVVAVCRRIAAAMVTGPESP